MKVKTMKRRNAERSSMVRVLLALDTIVGDRRMDTEIEIYFPSNSVMVCEHDTNKTALLVISKRELCLPLLGWYRYDQLDWVSD